MKKTIIYGMLLGLLTTASFAQRRAAEPGVVPNGRAGANMAPMAPGVGMGQMGQMSVPVTRVSPSAVNTTNHNGVAPDARPSSSKASHANANATTGSSTSTVKPNAASGTSASTVDPNSSTNRNASTVGPEANTNRTQAVTPDANGAADRVQVDPNQ